MNECRLTGGWSVLAFIALYLNFSPASAVEKYAVLVGVGDYIHLAEEYDLKGPRNDVELAKDLLLQKGISQANITLLTDGQPRAELPTRGNIIRTLDQHLEKAHAGDFVYLHFSGHGSQQPGTSNEIDGLDEIFLPADVKAWSKDIGAVENAIIDDEISDYVDAFREKDVFVWLVFDTCHSGTMTRGLWQNRKVAPSLLGIPLINQRNVSAEADMTPTIDLTSGSRGGEAREGQKKGGYVAFFAAQTAEETPEMDLPSRAEEKTRYGLFTYSLMQALGNTQGATYRRLAEKVVQTYASQPWYGSSPMFVGDGLDRTVFGNEPVEEVADQWALVRTAEGYEIPAGYLHGIARGMKLSLLETPDAKTEAAVGFVEVTEVHSVYSKVVLATPARKIDEQDSKWVNKIPAFSYVRRKGKNPDFNLSVSVITPAAKQGSNLQIAQGAIDLLRAENRSLSWVEEHEPADVRLLALGSRIYILNDSENLPCPMGPCSTIAKQHAYFSVAVTASQAETASSLTAALTKVAKALNLIRLGNVLDGDALWTELSVTRASDGRLERFQKSDSPALFAGDQLQLNVANYLEDPLDITVLFVGSDYAVDVVFPRGKQFNRFGFEEELDIPLGTINANSTGKERLVIISSEARNTVVPQDFSFLSQDGLTAGERNIDSGLAGLLKQAGFNQSGSRSTMEIQPSLQQRGSIHTISWTTSK